MLSASVRPTETIDADANGAVDLQPLIAATMQLDDVAPVLAGEVQERAGPDPKMHVAI